MARKRGTTEERGLGAAHRADRERLLAQHRDGDPCWRCGQPMYKWQELDRDHVVDRAMGGAQGPAVLAHKSCNRAAGAKLGNQMRAQGVILAAGYDTICAVCGKPYHYAAKRCEICGTHYHPNGREQHTCSRACGVELRRRKYGHAGRVSSRPRLPCAMCGKPCSTAKAKYCGRECADAAKRQIWPVSKVYYWTCRYCGELGVAKVISGQPREVCPARECQLMRLMANNLRVRKGMTSEQANAAVAAYRAEGDHHQIAAVRRWQAAGRRSVMPASGYAQDSLWVTASLASPEGSRRAKGDGYAQ